MVIIFALFFDLFFGDPPNRFHPTAWMGNLIGWLLRFRPRGNRAAEFMFGVFIIVIGMTLSIFAGITINQFTNFLITNLPISNSSFFILHSAFTALFLKLTISLRGLDRAAKEVQTALQKNDLIEARRLLSWHLVSRDTSQLTESQVAAAAIESVAENSSDGIIAPLFFFALGGLPAAFAYRFINTADSMLGYRDAEREWLGKFPARLDDVLNFIPARLAGLFIILAAPDKKQAWNIMRRDARQTESPNAGFPMSAMAGALGVELEKTGLYNLGKGLRLPIVDDLIHARRVLVVSVAIAAIFFAFLSLYV